MFKFATLNYLETVVLIHNVTTCPDAANDADRTVREIIAELSSNSGTVKRPLLESALYCCNMNDEQGVFWHPYNMSFGRFVGKILGKEYRFNRIYNYIEETRS